ncbi:YvrJ family protein [Clostridium cochlearium]|nr:YvrJ family protein [Clostridium cochlearium]
MYDELVKLISNVGFPVAVSVYLLVKLDKRLEQIIMLLSAMEHRERERKS